MQPMRWTIAGAFVTALGLALLAGAAEPVKLNIKTGLWEVSLQTQFSGASPFASEKLDKMPPEQRARFEAAMQASMANAAKPKLAKHCLTPEKLARGLDPEHRADDETCQQKIVKNTSSELQITKTCVTEAGNNVMDQHFVMSGSDTVSGTIHAVRTVNGQTSNVNSNLQGKWLSADCGNVKDFEMEK